MASFPDGLVIASTWIAGCQLEVLEPDEKEVSPNLRADSWASARPRWYQGRHDDDARQANRLGPS
ncbi:hypothetical protein [Sorangium sp. So ce1182]|uniref:hypothetical protein n=1 Tax=Sorangium sp. So ce1182 TaxID=3133334 RepID=UPI003F5E4711